MPAVLDRPATDTGAPTAATPRLSIVILSRNTRNLLARCLRSLSADPSAPPHEVILVDNGSRDGSVELAHLEFPEVRCLPQGRNLGFAAGMNVGLRSSSAPYVLLLNTDVEARPGSLAALVRCLEDNPQVGLVAPVLLEADGEVGRSVMYSPTFLRRVLPIGKWLQNRMQAQATRHDSASRGNPVEATEGAAIMVRREMLERVGPLDEGFFFHSEVVDWCLRIRAAGYDVRVLPDARMVHLGGGSSGGSLYAATRAELLRSNRRHVQKHLSPVSAALYEALDVSALAWRSGLYKLLARLPVRGAQAKADLYGALWEWHRLGRPARDTPEYRRLLGDWDS
jgi:N-acetylglucosaminyl-diphospho-decaprenol L-rhamnosyltransferase